jgi:hypothetical protein
LPDVLPSRLEEVSGKESRSRALSIFPELNGLD